MRPQRPSKYLLSLVFTGGLGIVALVVLAFSTPTIHPLPNPNGYDDILWAGKMIQGGITWRDPRLATLTQTQLSGLVASNAPALARLRLGLGKECRVPPHTAKQGNTRNFESGMRPLLAAALGLEGQLAEAEQRHSDAVNSYLDLIRLCHEACRGGDLSDYFYLQRFGVEAFGLYHLEGLLDEGHLDAKECQLVANALKKVDENAEPLQDILENDARYLDSSGWVSHLRRLTGMHPPIMGYDRKAFIESYPLRVLFRRRFLRTFADAAAGKQHPDAEDWDAEFLKALKASKARSAMENNLKP